MVIKWIAVALYIELDPCQVPSKMVILKGIRPVFMTAAGAASGVLGACVKEVLRRWGVILHQDMNLRLT